MQISKEEFREWKNNPVTQEVFEALRESRKKLMEDLANGHTLVPGHLEIQTSRVVGEIKGINLLLEINYEGGE